MTTTMSPPKPPKRLPKPVGLLIVALLVLGLVGLLVLGGHKLYAAAFGAPDYSGTGSGTVTVQIMTGDSAADIGDTLVTEQVVKSVKAFTKAAKADPKSRSLQPGFYSLHRHMRASSALTLLLSPSARLLGRVTLPEGIELKDVVDRMVKYTTLKRPDVLAALSNPAVLGLPSYADNKPEGFLFPATYDVEPGSAAVDALQQMTQKFSEEAAGADLVDGAKALSLTPYQVVTIASIIEQETAVPADRAKVARVVLNRLKAGMRLQLDSTLNYVLAERAADPSLTQIKSNSPYNTYVNTGLPPTPIDSPGRAALDAALHPATGNWIYFVTIDKAGNSFFTNDYNAFLAAKAKAKRDGVY